MSITFFNLRGEAKALTEFKQWIKPQLNPSQRILDIHEDRPELGSALERAERYLGLSSIVVILISGVAIAMATRRYTERHFNATALLRCLGCKQNEILWLYSSQFIVLGVVSECYRLFVGLVCTRSLVPFTERITAAARRQSWFIGGFFRFYHRYGGFIRFCPAAVITA